MKFDFAITCVRSEFADNPKENWRTVPGVLRRLRGSRPELAEGADYIIIAVPRGFGHRVQTVIVRFFNGNAG